MIIINKEARLISVPIPEGDPKKPSYRHHLLKPGANELPDEDVTALQNSKNAMVKRYFQFKLLEVPSEKAQPKGEGSLESMTVPEAEQLVSETYDTDLLRQWDAADQRKGVKQAIAAQLKTIESVGQGSNDES